MTAVRDLQRLIHVGCRELGLDGEVRRDLQLRLVGKASMTDMDKADLQKLLEALKQQGFKPGFKGVSKGRRKPAGRADVRYLHVLWRLLAEAGKVDRPGAAGLNAFVRARFGQHWGAEPIDIDTLQDAGQINDVTRALKAMCARHGIATELDPRGRS